MKKGQSALEYLIMMIAVLVVAAVVVLFMSGALGTQKTAGNLEECRTAAAACSRELVINEKSPCTMCNEPCSGDLSVFKSICKSGLADEIFQPECQNGKQESYEQCDGNDLADETCLTMGYESGMLSCTDQCTFNFSACYKCGDGTVSSPEVCDGANLAGQDCTTKGYTDGTLACASNCLSFITTGCYNAACHDNAECNDGAACTTDVCNNPGLPTASCTHTAITACVNGDGCCAPGCNAVNDNDCSAVCGNNVKEGSEQCDGTDKAGQTCVTMGFAEGTLSCVSCNFNTAGCQNNYLAVGGASSTVLFSNGNGTWLSRPISGSVVNVSTIQQLTENSIIVGGNNSQIRDSPDRGVNWNSRTSGISNHIYSSDFINATHGWMCAYYSPSPYNVTFINTTNGGVNWANQSITKAGVIMNDVDFINKTHGFAGGTTTYNGYNTTNGGVTWTSLGTVLSTNINGVDLLPSGKLWVVGASGNIANSSGILLTWNAQTSTTVNNLNGVDFINATHGWAVGASGTMLATTNGGSTWNQKTSGTSNELWEVCFKNATKGWAVGNVGTIIRTDDGGSTWAPETSGTSNAIYTIDCTIGPDELVES